MQSAFYLLGVLPGLLDRDGLLFRKVNLAGHHADLDVLLVLLLLQLVHPVRKRLEAL